MAADWKDILGALGNLPEGPETEVPAADDSRPAEKRSVTLFYERKGRAGKPVTILADFSGIGDGEIEQLASSLKRSLGTGGSVRGGEILIQGDRRVDLRKLLEKSGFKVKG